MKRPALVLLLHATTSTIFFSFAIPAAISTISDPLDNPTGASTPAPAISMIPNTINPIRRRSQASLNTSSSNASADQTTSSLNGKQASPQASRVAHSRQQGATKQPAVRRQQAAIGNSKQQQKGNDETRQSSAASGNQRSRSLAVNSGGSQANSVDPLALAQQQARLMMGYNNTPPLFVTGTRDFFVDVARYPLGTKLTTMKAVDIDGDHLEYSLQLANLHDASPYFSIDSINGELKLANKQFQFHQEHSQSSIETKSSSDKDSNDDSNDSEDDQGSQADENEDGQSSSAFADVTISTSTTSTTAAATNPDDELMNRNLYFLNVAADDGRYTSVVELQIHVINSSSLAELQSLTDGLPVQLAPEGSKRASERMESFIHKKTKEFYDKLNTVSSTSSAQVNNSTIVYPNFVNPSLIRPTTVDVSNLQSVAINAQSHQEESNQAASNHVVASKPAQQRNIGISSPSTPRAAGMVPLLVSTTEQHSQSLLQDQQQQLIKQSMIVGSLVSKTSAEPSAQSFDTLVPQPILVSLVVFCSCLTIALVSLAFLIPSTMRKLRKELKHVERQHGQLSQQASIGSSTVCSSSSSSMVTHTHNSSLSQFTLNSDRTCTTRGDPGSTVCRQSSLDSTLTVMSPQRSILALNQPVSRVNNGSITNPVYLDQPQQRQQQPQQHQQCHLFTTQQANINQIQHSVQQQRTLVNNSNPNNHYYPLDDNDKFYSTIETESTVLGSCSNRQQQQRSLGHKSMKLDSDPHNYFMADCAPPPPPPPAQQTEVCESGAFETANIMSPDSLTLPCRSPLARFLSLPVRHSLLQQTATSVQSAKNSYIEEQLIDLNDNSSVRSSNSGAWAQHHQVASSKTIARSSNISREQQSNNSQADKWELERHELKYIELLGEGQFGLVFRCILRQGSASSGSSIKEQVAAVKTLKVNVSRDVRGREEFLAEIEIMKLVCNHPNVVRILHCCTKDVQINDETQATLGGKPILLVMEYVELGKLQSFLERSRMNHDYTTSSHSNCSESTNDRLTSRDLVKFIYHVAKGMEYIGSQCIVHRDIASRNILVSSQRICKIGDFGMARHMQSSTGVYERHSLNTKIPVRWMAPEVLLNNKFTTKSDVFSFGILMWEIVTLGSTPYTHLRTEQVINRVARNGERPIKPEYCHAQLYKIMSKCWSHEPDDRPTFTYLAKQFDELLLSANNYIELDQYPNHNYYNIPKSSAPFELL